MSIIKYNYSKENEEKKIENSPRQSKNNLVINLIEFPSNLTSSRQSNHFDSIINELNEENINENDENTLKGTTLNKTSSFPINDSINNSYIQNSLISQKQISSKINSMNAQISFKKEGFKYTLFCNEVKENNYQTTNSTKNNSYKEKKSENENENNKNKNLLNPNTIPLYSQQYHLKLFNDFIQKKKPVIFSHNTENNKIFGFCAFTFDNNDETKTKITININLNTEEEKNINYFSLYNKTLNKEILNNLITLNTKEQLNIIKKINDEIFLIKSLSNYIIILTNSKLNQNYISIISSNQATKLELLYNKQKINYDENLDFLILMDKGIFKNLYCIEICYMIYDIMKTCLINDETFEEFLNQIIIYIFEQTLVNGGNNEMSLIFICFKGIKNMFNKRNINKIDEILNRLENTTYEIDYKNMQNYRKLNKKEINLPQKIKIDNYCNLTFKKTLTGGDFGKVNKNQRKSFSIFKCCGL